MTQKNSLLAERVYLKLGTGCNLHCKYCHAESNSIQFNPAILPVLRGLPLKFLAFGGGEPLLYWNYIKQTVEYLGKGIRYRIVTNGTMFTHEIVDFFNAYNFYVFISLDGLHSTRDNSKPIRWDLIRKLRHSGTAVTFYRENANIRATLESLNTLKSRYLTFPATIYSSFPNFVHSTAGTGKISDRQLADSYIAQISEILEEAFVLFKKGQSTGFIESAFMRFVQNHNYHGIHCANAKYFPLLADGTICSCPYTFDKIGDIFHLDAIDWDAVKQKYSRLQCSSCKLFSICGNSCCMNITDDECYIMRKLYQVMLHYMDIYDVSYDELDKASKS